MLCALGRSTRSAILNCACRFGHVPAAPLRGQYVQLTDEDVAAFQQLIGAQHAITEASILKEANRDWTGRYVGSSGIVLRPATTLEVCAVLKFCNDRRLAVVVQGGNTGLVGGATPAHTEVILSTSRMSQIISFDAASGAVVAQAGAVLDSINTHVQEQGWMLPYDFGSKRVCQIGGNVSTNAGGLRLLRYGSLHGSTLGLEVALADGRRLDLLKTLRKDNTGYDLKQLFIGAEGTLGVVTQVAMQCVPKPKSEQTLLLAVDSWSHVLALLATARQQLGEILAAFEFFEKDCMLSVNTHLSRPNPLASWVSSKGEPPFYVLLGTHGSCAAHDREKMDTFLKGVLSNGQALSGVMADGPADVAAMWSVREGIAESCGKRGAVFKYDVSVPQQSMYALVEHVREHVTKRCGDKIVGVVNYGHVGDGNVHINVIARDYSPTVQDALEPFIYECVAAQKGSISAEHGLGQQKSSAIGYSQPPEAIAIMQQLKRVFDPNMILCPGISFGA